MLFDQDEAGKDFNPLDYLQRLSAIANRPTYSWVDSTMGRGAVGGSLYQQARLIDALVGRSTRILQGESVDQIPVSTVDLNATLVDWRQLHRWGISESRVPEGAVVLFHPPSVWVRYRADAVGFVIVLVAVGTLATRRRERRLQKENALQANQRMRNLNQEMLRAHEAERSQIARELHDDIGQQAAVLSIHLHQLQRLRRKQDHRSASEDILRAALDRTRDLADSARDLSHELHPPQLRVFGIVAALDDLASDFTTDDVSVLFSHRDVPASVADEIKLCVFRVAQEGLRNAVEHGKASCVQFDLVGQVDRLTLIIADDGTGFDLGTRRSGLGLLSIEERVQAVGGSCVIDSRPGSGTRIVISIPNGSAVDS